MPDLTPSTPQRKVDIAPSSPSRFAPLMSTDNKPSTPSAKKPPAFLWPDFAVHLQRFVNLNAEEKLAAIPKITEVVSPFIHWAVSDFAQRHALLIDEPDSHRLLFSHVIGLERVPTSMELFILRLQSIALKQVVAERTALTSSLTCAQPSWTGFRKRFNNLNLTDRGYLLARLPQTSLALLDVERKELPDGKSIKLWHEVSSGVSQQELPVEWQRFAAENSAEELQRIETLLKPSTVPNFALPNIVLGRESNAKTVKKLGRWLFRAAATQEHRLGDASKMELILPDWVIPKARAPFLGELSSIFSANGGVPEEPVLRSLLLQSHDSLERGLWIPDSFSASKIISSLHDLGEMRCNTSALFGMHLARLQDKAGAELAYARQLNQALTSSEVATALANLAGLRIKYGDLDEADRMLREAVRLNPWSQVATNLLVWLRKAESKPVSGESHAQ